MNPLKLQRILDTLAGQCQTDLGHGLARKLRPVPDRSDAERRLDRTEEALILLRSGVPVPLALRLDVAQLLVHAERGGTLDGAELAVLFQIARCTMQLRSQGKDWPTQAAQLRHDASQLPDLGLLAGLLADSVDEEGRILDSASPLLAKLRADVLTLAARLRKRIADLVKETDEAGILQDEYFTLRDDRYVLPVKSSDKRVLGGIIHGSSQTGQTVYVEPQEMVEGNNHLALAYEAVRREEHRILQELSGLCGEQAEQFTEAGQALATLDLTLAFARLAEKLEANRPTFTDDGSLDVRKARHPLLVLDGVRVVPNDVAMQPPARWLIISGPNGGGKTVVLATLGLAIEMARLGLHICAAHDSRVPWFDSVHVVLGDAQDIERGLSTFEGHLRAVQSALKAATSSAGRVLVLLDELASGTEPIAGSALATAILESVSRNERAAGAVTTHFEALKLLALREPAFVNAALELDTRTLTPTYQLKLGEVGSSNPLALAERIGLDPAIVQRAGQLAGGGGSEVAQMLDRLSQDRQLLHDRLAEVEKQQLQLDRSRALLEDQRRNEQVAAERRIEKAAAQAMAELAAVQRDLDAARRALKSGEKHTMDDAARTMTQRQAEVQRMKERAEQAKGGQVQRLAIPEEGPVVDSQVWHEGLGRVMTVAAIDTRAKRVRVRAGLLETWASPDDLRRPLPTDPGYKAPPKVVAHKPQLPKQNTQSLQHQPQERAPLVILPLPGSETQNPEHEETLALRSPEWTCDLRGQRKEEALEMVDRLLDRAVVESARGICVVHGLGTGALREAVRQHLKKHPQVARFRAGIRGEGGDGATLVWVKD